MELEIGQEIIYGLGEDPRPIDGVDGTEMVSLVEGCICEEGLDDILGSKV